MSLPQLGQTLIRRTEEYLRAYRRHLEREERTQMCLIDRQAFVHLIEQLTEYALEMLSHEWESTKNWREALAAHKCSDRCRAEKDARNERVAAREARREARDRRQRRRQRQARDGELLTPAEEDEKGDEAEAARDAEEEEDGVDSARCPPELPKEPGCMSACQLPLRYGLPCRHWLWASAATEISIPLSLVPPRWLRHAPEGFQGQWEMAWRPEDLDQAEWRWRRELALQRDRGDVYRRRGEDLMLKTVLALTDQQEKLTSRHKVPFARSFAESVAQFMSYWRDKASKEEQQEVRLSPPNPIRQQQIAANRKSKGSKRARAPTAAELADAAAVAECKQQAAQRQQVEASAAAAKREKIAKEEGAAESERIERIRTMLDAAVAVIAQR